jgi:hypothetical protein
LGRDFIRLLQSASLQFGNELKSVWDIVMSGENGEFLDAILSQPTHPDLLRLLIPFELEQKLTFLMQDLEGISDSQYNKIAMDVQNFLAVEEGIVPDVMRFICGCLVNSQTTIHFPTFSRWGFFLALLRAAKVSFIILNDYSLFLPRHNQLLDLCICAYFMTGYSTMLLKIKYLQ